MYSPLSQKETKLVTNSTSGIHFHNADTLSCPFGVIFKRLNVANFSLITPDVNMRENFGEFYIAYRYVYVNANLTSWGVQGSQLSNLFNQQLLLKYIIDKL